MRSIESVHGTSYSTIECYQVKLVGLNKRQFATIL
jgi:hypothetical protein